MKTHRREARKARGQVLVIYTIALVALLGAVALCTDVAVLYFNWGQLQKAADAAAVAGAHYLPNDTSTATTTAYDYAAKNGVPSGEVVSVTFNANDTQITVKLQRTVGLFFARVLKMLSAPVTVQATAEVQPAGGVGGILPIGLWCSGTDVSTCGTACTTLGDVTNCKMKYGIAGTGNWEPLALGANGANAYRNSLANGYTGTLETGTTISVSTEPGNMMGPTLQGLGDRLAASAYPGSIGSPDQAPVMSTTSPGSPVIDSRLVLVPMVDYSGAQGKTSVPIMSFALAWIGSVDSTGEINIYFLKSGVTPDSVFPSSGGADTGLYGVALIN